MKRRSGLRSGAFVCAFALALLMDRDSHAATKTVDLDGNPANGAESQCDLNLSGNFPVVFEDLVILGSVIVSWGDMATPAHRFMAFDKLTGQFRWISSTRLRPPDTIYSAPVLATLGGVVAIYVFSVWAGAIA